MKNLLLLLVLVTITILYSCKKESNNTTTNTIVNNTPKDPGLIVLGDYIDSVKYWASPKTVTIGYDTAYYIINTDLWTTGLKLHLKIFKGMATHGNLIPGQFTKYTYGTHNAEIIYNGVVTNNRFYLAIDESIDGLGYGPSNPPADTANTITHWYRKI